MFDPRMYGQVAGMGGSFPRQYVYKQAPQFGGGGTDSPQPGSPKTPPPGRDYRWDGFKWVRIAPPTDPYKTSSNAGG